MKSGTTPPGQLPRPDAVADPLDAGIISLPSTRKECSMFRSKRCTIVGVLLTLLLLTACGQSGTGAAATALPQATQAPQPTAMAEATAATAPTAMAEATAATAPTAMAEATAAPAAGGDLLAEVKTRGKLVIATDANY